MSIVRQDELESDPELAQAVRDAIEPPKEERRSGKDRRQGNRRREELLTFVEDQK